MVPDLYRLVAVHFPTHLRNMVSASPASAAMRAGLIFLLGLGGTGTLRSQALVTIDTVLVGNAGNPAANSSNAAGWGSNYGFGAVAYNYRIGRTEVTISQYVAFLNAVATAPTTTFEEDLWIPNMQTNAAIAGVLRSGEGTPASPYSYSVIGTGTRPIVGVSFYGAAAFANWLNNGATPSSGIWSGAYTISTGPVTQVSRSGNVATLTSPGHTLTAGDQVSVSGVFGYDGSFVVTAVTANTFSYVRTGSDESLSAANGRFIGASATRDGNATWWVPNENEWVKAAYYNPNGSGSYTLYANRSDAMTSNLVGAGGAANFRDFGGTGWAVTQSLDFSDQQNYLTEAGAYGGTLSFYGTLDQAGNVSEWNETIPTQSQQSRVLRGGHWGSLVADLRASARGLAGPTAEVGFRVATLGEPIVNMPPTLALGGPARIRTTKSRVAIRGTTSDSGGVVSVSFRVGSKGGFKTAKGTTSWQFIASLKPGRNVIEVFATDAEGLKSGSRRVTAIRKKKS